MGKYIQKRPSQISIKADADLYKKLAEEAHDAERSVSAQLRVILRERYEGATA